MTARITRSAAWSDFENSLAAILEALEEDQFLVISVKTADWAYVQFAAHGAFGLRAEMVSNNFIPADKKFTADQIEALVGLGWHPPTGTPREVAAQRQDKRSPNFFRDFDRPVLASEVAQLAVRSLTEVARMQHPGMLEYTAFDREGRDLVLPTLKLKRRPKAPPPADVPVNTVERVRVQVLESIRKATDNADLEYIEGRRIQLRFGSAIVFVRVHKEPLCVSVSSPIVMNVDADSPTLERLNELNAKIRFARFFLKEGTIYAVEEVSATPFVVEQLLHACARLGTLADKIDDVLQKELGGRTTFGEFQAGSRVH
jgi:hypothetical protein